MSNRVGFFACLAGIAFAAGAQQMPQALPADPSAVRAVYDRLLPQIEKIAIFDNHSHPGFADDANVDAMAAPPGAASLRLRADNPELVAASKALFAYPYDDATPEHLKWLAGKKAVLRKQETGYEYFDRILDTLHVEMALANRVVLGPYLSPKRFRWVFFVDSLLFPLDNQRLKAKNGDLAVYVPLQEQKLHHELEQAGLQQRPLNFDAYLAFVTRLLEQNQHAGGVAIKFEIAYFRPLDFADPSKEAAAAIYEKYRVSGTPTDADYKTLQDYLFRYLLREAGRLHLPVHLHTAVGIGDYYNLTGSTALNLEPILRDPRYDATTFVLLHGGYPFQDQAIWLAARKNVYLDSSLIELYLYPADFKNCLRRWLLLFPDKVVFGSDAFPFSEAVGAEESYWIAVRSVRLALTSALAEMIVNGEVTEPRAVAFAHAYLHDTAASLYGSPSL